MKHSSFSGYLIHSACLPRKFAWRDGAAARFLAGIAVAGAALSAGSPPAAAGTLDALTFNTARTATFRNLTAWTPRAAKSQSSLAVPGGFASANGIPVPGNTWTGLGASGNWSDSNNWGGAQPGYGTLTFSGSTRTTNTDDNITSMNQLLWTGTSAWTLNQGGSTVLSLFDNGGTQAKVENDSTGLVTINLPLTFAATAGAAWGEINAVNGNLTFGTGTLTVNGSSVNGIKLFGTGHTTTFANTVSASGKWFGLTSANTTMDVSGGFTSGDIYVMNGGTLNLDQGGSITTSAIRLGGDYGNTGNQNLAAGGTFAVTSTNGGQNFSGTITTAPSNTSNAEFISSLNTTGINTLSGGIYLDSGLTIQNSAGGTLNLTGTTDFKAQTLTFNPSGTIVASGQLISSTSSSTVTGGTLVKTGSGTLILQNTANTYSGTSSSKLNGNSTQISAGTLGIYGDGSLGVAPAGAYNNIQFTGSGTLQDTANNISLNVNRNISVASSATATFDTLANTLTVNGQITGSGAITKNGTGTLLLLAGSGNTFTGGVTLNAGTLGVNLGNDLGALPGTLTTDLTFAGNSTFQFESASTGAVAATRQFAINSGVTATFDTQSYSDTDSGVITGSGALTKIGSGTLTLTGSNNFTGGTLISAGALQIGSGGTTGSLSTSSAITDNSSLIFNRSNTVTAGTDFSGNPISGTGSITQNGSGLLVLWSGNTFTGGVTINSGTVGIFEGSGLGAIPSTAATDLTFGGNSTLQFMQTPTSGALNGNRQIVINPGVKATIDTQSYNPSINGQISGSTGSLTKIGTGTLTLSGNDTYGGGTTINAGTLTLGNTSALGSSTGSLTLSGGTVNPNGTRGATLNLNGNSATVGALTSADQSSFNGFNLGSGANTLTASSASISGTNYIGINNATSITSTGTYNLISSGSAMTGGGTWTFTGAQDLTVPVNSIIAKNSSGNFYRLTLNNTGTTEQVIVTNNNLGNMINIMPLGASLSFGTSSTGTAKNGTVITSYNGSGYHSQLYQNLVNDGRFNPNFVGSSTSTGAVNSSGASILSTVGQTASEGHPGYTNSQILYNLNNNDGNSSANGGNWLKANNGVNPTYVPLNVGGNDFTVNSSDTNAILRYDAIVTQLNTLRPGVATIVTSLMYRTDIGASQDTLYNPYVQGIVYNHALAGQNVRYLDLYNILTPGDSQSILSADGIHPTQAGYDQEANAWSESLLYGAAYYKGGNNGVWSSVNGTTTNFAVDSSLTTDRQKSLTDASTRTYTGAYADVWFNNNATALATTLGADTTVRSLNFASGAAGAVSIGGPNTLTIGAGGITVQQGTGAHTVSANVALGAAQTWGNVSSNAFTVSGIVNGSNALTIAGSYTTYNPGSVTGVSTSGGELYTPTASTYVGSGSIVLTGNNTYTGSTTINQYGALQIGNGGTTGSLSTSSAITDNGALTFNRSNTITQGTGFANVISGTGSVTQNGTGNLVLSGNNTYTGATNINSGTLAVNGDDTAATGAVTVASGATLTGTGKVGGASPTAAPSTQARSARSARSTPEPSHSGGQHLRL